MVLNLIEYTGQKLLELNPYLDNFAANCIKLKDGSIVNFIGEEKQDFSPSDIVGTGAYARFNPSDIVYTSQTRRLFSDEDNVMGTVRFRIVVFQINRTPKIHPAKLENKITNDLRFMDFSGYTGSEQDAKIAVNVVNMNFLDIFKQEIGSDYNVGADSIIVAFNCTLTWSAGRDNCEACDVFEEPEKC